MKNELTKEIAYKELQNFFKNPSSPLVLFGSGMSCAVDTGFGMEALKKELIEKLGSEKLSKSQETQWSNVLNELNNDIDLEKALNKVKDKILLNKIVKITGDYLSEIDRIYSLAIAKGECDWPAGKLFKKLVDKLPETDRALHVATSNYDMLAEYAFEFLEVPYINGFSGGIKRNLDWPQSIRSITCVEKALYGKKIKSFTRERKHIRLYKIHGSLNLFIFKDKIIENNTWLYEQSPNDNDIERLIITPGESKHEKLLKYRSGLLKPFDDAVEKHNAFLFLGFGFNDSQFTGDILKKCIKQKVSLHNQKIGLRPSSG